MARRVPMTMVMAANMPIVIRQRSAMGSSPSPQSRITSAKAATFDNEAMCAVTGNGAPSYTSGAHMWKGTAESLKPTPAAKKARINHRQAFSKLRPLKQKNLSVLRMPAVIPKNGKNVSTIILAPFVGLLKRRDPLGLERD